VVKKSHFLLLIIAAVALAACQTGMQGVDGDDINGIYYLSKVDGSPVPGTVSHDGVAMEVHSGTFMISADGTCFSRTRFVVPGGEQMTREVSARYVVKDSRLVMTWEGAGVTEGTVDGDTFVMDNHGMIFEYIRGLRE